MKYENVVISDKGSIRIVTINRPKVLNALDQKTLLELEEIFRTINNEGKTRAVIINGAGEKSFVAGADIKQMRDLSPLAAQNCSLLGHRVFDSIVQSQIPVIAAVNGYALGGGLELALACDFIYASEKSSFGLVETKLGLIPGFGGIARLVRRIGDAKTRELIYTAAQLNAQEALRIGLINRISTEQEDVVVAAEQTALLIAQNGPYAIHLVKKLISDGQDTNWHTANTMEQACFGLVFSSQDHREGIDAFLEKRKAIFNGK